MMGERSGTGERSGRRERSAGRERGVSAATDEGARGVRGAKARTQRPRALAVGLIRRQIAVGGESPPDSAVIATGYEGYEVPWRASPPASGAVMAQPTAPVATCASEVVSFHG